MNFSTISKSLNYSSIAPEMFCIPNQEPEIHENETGTRRLPWLYAVTLPHCYQKKGKWDHSHRRRKWFQISKYFQPMHVVKRILVSLSLVIQLFTGILYYYNIFQLSINYIILKAQNSSNL